MRKHLLLAAESKIARGDSLGSRLYAPEVFSVDQRDAISSRRMAQWSQAIAAPGKPQHLMLLVAEVKQIVPVPARDGFKAGVKHVSDQAFALDEQIYRRLGRRFESALALWGAADDIHRVMIATFSRAAAGIPTSVELSLMPVTRQWLPVVGVGAWFEPRSRSQPTISTTRPRTQASGLFAGRVRCGSGVRVARKAACAPALGLRLNRITAIDKDGRARDVLRAAPGQQHRDGLEVRRLAPAAGPGEQLCVVPGLVQEVIGAQLEGGQPLLPVVLHRDHHHRERYH